MKRPSDQGKDGGNSPQGDTSSTTLNGIYGAAAIIATALAILAFQNSQLMSVQVQQGSLLSEQGSLLKAQGAGQAALMSTVSDLKFRFDATSVGAAVGIGVIALSANIVKVLEYFDKRAASRSESDE